MPDHESYSPDPSLVFNGPANLARVAQGSFRELQVVGQQPDNEGLAGSGEEVPFLRPQEGHPLGIPVDEGVDTDVAEHPLGGFELDDAKGVVEAATPRTPTEWLRGTSR